MKPYIVVLLLLLGLGAQPSVAGVPSAFCGDIVAADPAPAPEPEPEPEPDEEEEPDCE